MEPIQRYNQGFGVFGPLEKCDTGKLAFYADMEAEYSRLQTQVTEETTRRIDAEAYSERRTKQIYDLTGANTTLRKRIAEFQEWGDAQFEKADALEWDVKALEQQIDTLKAELATAKLLGGFIIGAATAKLLGGFIIGAAIGKAFF